MLDFDVETLEDDAAGEEAVPSLLFVDDERAILTALRVVFRAGYEVTVTTDGREAVEMMKRRHFDVIVSDQRMPLMTGVEVLSQAQQWSPRSIRILLTGYSDTDAILAAINEVEVHRFLQKPWDNQRLKKVVDEAVELARGQADLEPEQPPLGTIVAAADVAAVSASATLALPAPTAAAAAEVAPADAPSMAQADSGTDSTLSMEPPTVLVVEPGRAISDVIRQHYSGANVVSAKNADGVFETLQATSVSAMVWAFDPESEVDRAFLHLLKREYPFILVIAICNAADTTRLIELINHMKIFRYIRQPVSSRMLLHYLTSATKMAGEARSNRAVMMRQKVEPLAVTATTQSMFQALEQRFARARESIWRRFAFWLMA